MKLESRQVRRLEAFLELQESTGGGVPSGPVDVEITRRMVEFMLSEYPLAPGSRVLDLGCRDATAMDLFAARGLQVVGVTQDPALVDACRGRGGDARLGGVSFLELEDEAFSLVWCRQALAASAMPLFSLAEIHRVLAPGGLLYLELPSPGTSAAHEGRPDLCSVLAKETWLELLRRAGFERLQDLDLSFTTPAGPDVYWALVSRRPLPEAPAVPVPPPRRPSASVYLLLPVGSMHGWGICGKQIARHLATMTSVRLVTEPFTPEHVGGEIDHWELQRLLPDEAEMQALSEGDILRVDCPVLVGIGDEQLRPGARAGRGSRTVGYTFFERNRVSPEAIERARASYDLVTTGSTWCTEILRSSGLSEVETVIQGVDTALFDPSPMEREYFRDRFVVFSGGKFELRKGQDLVMKAVRVLQQRHPDVLLVASWFNFWGHSVETMRQSPHIRFQPPSSGRFHDIVGHVLADNGMDPSRTVLLGPQPNAAMARIYKNTDLGLFPNRCEGGTNLVLMEYMACGLPVIASNSSGHRDILTAENSVRLERLGTLPFRSGGQEVAVWDDPDPDEIIEQLEWAYQHRDRLAPIARRAGDDLARYSWRATAEHFHRLLLGNRG